MIEPRLDLVDETRELRDQDLEAIVTRNQNQIAAKKQKFGNEKKPGKRGKEKKSANSANLEWAPNDEYK